MRQAAEQIIEESLLDMVRLMPFLFLTYLAMEYLEHRTGERARGLLRWSAEGSSALCTVLGGLLGAAPQCGFSAAASNLYAGRLITRGTLLAVYLSTSDEMLPVLISERAPAGMVWKLLAMKAGVGIAAGLAVDLLSCIWTPKGRADFRKGDGGQGRIGDICQQERCRCGEGILRPALSHALKIGGFLLAVNLGLNLMLHFMGEDALGSLLLNRPILGPVLAGAVGLIPNCAGSVAITELYLAGSMSLGSAMAGLLAGSGVGLLVLFRVSRDRRENLRMLGLLYGIGVVAGIAIGWASGV